MTNGEYIEKTVERDEDFCLFTDNSAGTVTIEVSLKWWNKPKENNSKREASEEIRKLAKFHSIEIPIVYGDGTKSTDRVISLSELGIILGEVLELENEDESEGQE